MNKSSRTKNHIAIVMDNLRDGGVERVRLDYSQLLAENGYIVDLVICSFEGVLIEQIPEEVNLFVYDDQCKAILSSHERSNSIDRKLKSQSNTSISLSEFYCHIRSYWPFGLKVIPTITNKYIVKSRAFAMYLTEEQPDLVVCSKDAIYYSLIGREISKTSIPVVCSIHNAIATETKRAKQLIRSMLPRAEAIFTVSLGIAQELADFGYCSRDRITTVYNPKSTTKILSLTNQPSGHPWIHLKRKSKHKIILTVGRLHKQKNHALLIRSFSQIPQTILCKLIIIGEGKERENLQQLVKNYSLEDRVSLPGWVANPYAFMFRADVFVLTSNWEGLPNVIVEALACGCNIVSTDCQHGPKEILDHGKFGMLVPVNNEMKLTSAIYEALKSEPNRGILLSRANKYSSKKIFPVFKNFINQFLMS